MTCKDSEPDLQGFDRIARRERLTGDTPETINSLVSRPVPTADGQCETSVKSDASQDLRPARVQGAGKKHRLQGQFGGVGA